MMRSIIGCCQNISLEFGRAGRPAPPPPADSRRSWGNSNSFRSFDMGFCRPRPLVRRGAKLSCGSGLRARRWMLASSMAQQPTFGFLDFWMPSQISVILKKKGKQNGFSTRNEKYGSDEILPSKPRDLTRTSLLSALFLLGGYKNECLFRYTPIQPWMPKFPRRDLWPRTCPQRARLWLRFGSCFSAAEVRARARRVTAPVDLAPYPTYPIHPHP